MLSTESPQQHGMPLLSIIGSKLFTADQSFTNFKSLIIYLCNGGDKNVFKRRQDKGPYITDFDRHGGCLYPLYAHDEYLWYENSVKGIVSNVKYERMYDEFSMGILCEQENDNKWKINGLMKISLMSDGRILLIGLEDYPSNNGNEEEFDGNMKDYTEKLKEYILISKMSGKHLLILVYINRINEEEKLDHLMKLIKNCLDEFSMLNVKIICLYWNDNVSKAYHNVHPLASDLHVIEAIFQFREEIMKDLQCEKQEMKLNHQGSQFAIMGKVEKTGVGTVLIGRVLSGSIQVGQSILMSNRKVCKYSMKIRIL